MYRFLLVTMPAQTEQILKAVLDYAPENIVLMDPDYKVICFNDRIRQTLYHYHQRYLETGDDYRDFVVEMAMPTFLTAFDHALGGQITELEMETVAEHLTLWFRYRVNPVYTPSGELLGVSLSAEDITARIMAQRELSRSEAKFRSLIEQSQVGAFILTGECFSYINPALQNILCLEVHELSYEQKLADFIHDDNVAQVNQSCSQVLLGEEEVIHLTVTAIRKDGAVRTWELSISRIAYNESWALLGSILDITRRVDEEIRLNEAVDQAQEMQRLEIGMELHDNVKQQLVSAMLTMQLSMEPNNDNGAQTEMIAKSIGYLQQSINELRQLSHRLAPAVDDETGIFEKINDLIARMNVKSNLQVVIRVDEACKDIGAHIQLVVYRIIQEQFCNIMSYADAHTVNIRLYNEAGYAVIAIEDDGNGVELTKKTSGIGLENIRRRVQVLGGSVRISSSPGNGFSLTAMIPL
jgi:PAS domain S-box-containing protein